LAVAAATVIKDSIGYKLYYHGWSDPYEPWDIGLATSMDGINWTKYPTPVLYASSGMEFQLAPSAVLMIDDIYYMYYSGMNNSCSDIRLATSIDGITWTKYSGNPILSKDENWEGTGIYSPSVLKIDNQFVMIFMDRMGTGFGRAVSSDGINWQKSDNNPFFTKYNTYNNWGIGKISYPNFIKINNQERVYYSAFGNNPPFEIGFVSR